MTESERIFIDTSPIIYLVEKTPKYYQAVADYFKTEFAIKESFFFISTMGIAEFLVKPKQSKNTQVEQDFKELLKELNFTIIDLSVEIAEISSDLRAKYPFLKNFDSIQIASALKFKCNTFLTNDKDLKKVNELKVILINELIQ